MYYVPESHFIHASIEVKPEQIQCNWTYENKSTLSRSVERYGRLDRPKNLIVSYTTFGRQQWLRGLRHELSLPPRKLESYV
jgi:hypothetical protein